MDRHRLYVKAYRCMLLHTVRARIPDSGDVIVARLPE